MRCWHCRAIGDARDRVDSAIDDDPHRGSLPWLIMTRPPAVPASGSAPHNARLDGADANTERLGDFGRAELLEVSHHQYLTIA